MNGVKFGTDGWRGIIGFDFTLDRIITVAEAIRQYLVETSHAEKPIIISHDTRFLSPEFARQTANYLTSRGMETWLLEGYTPTPVCAFAVMKHKACGAIVFTASHNPYYYSGLKFIPHFAGPAETETTDRISEIVNSLLSEGFSVSTPPTEFKGKKLDVKEEYFDHIGKLINGAAIKTLNAKVLYSPFYGCGQGYVRGFLDRYSIEVHRMHLGRDVIFGRLLPDPSPENMKLLLPRLRELKLDLAVATDGDADRFGIMTPEGEYFGANKILPLLADYLIGVRKMEGALVRTVVTSHMLDDVATFHQMEGIETKVGFKYVGKCLRDGALIGGEESGGISIKGHIPEKDGILSVLLTLEMVATSGMSLTELFKKLAELHHPYVYERIDLRVTEEIRAKILDSAREASMKERAFGYTVSAVKDLDGIKIILENGSWVAFRRSGTENVLRVYFEGRNEDAFERLKKELAKFIRACGLKKWGLGRVSP